MTKFGEIIASEILVLVCFYQEYKGNYPVNMDAFNEVLRDTAASMGDKVKVIKIDIDNNETLANALRIKITPTYIVYKEGQMKYRGTKNNFESGYDSLSLIGLLKKHI